MLFQDNFLNNAFLLILSALLLSLLFLLLFSLS